MAFLYQKTEGLIHNNTEYYNPPLRTEAITELLIYIAATVMAYASWANNSVSAANFELVGLYYETSLDIESSVI